MVSFVSTDGLMQLTQNNFLTTILFSDITPYNCNISPERNE